MDNATPAGEFRKDFRFVVSHRKAHKLFGEIQQS
jgi:hypothetical protein